MVDKKMADKKRLLEIRKKIKSRKPEFIQQDYHKKRRLSKKWKRPTGLQSKMRHQFRGYNRRVKQGWRSPIEIRGYHGKGVEPILVNNVSDLNSVKSDQGVVIASNVGLKKRLDIVKKAQELKLIILNVNPENIVNKAESLKKQKEETKKEKQEKKKKTIEDSLKKAEKKQKSAEKSADKSEEKSEEDKKAEEKKEKDEVLIHKQ